MPAADRLAIRYSKRTLRQLITLGFLVVGVLVAVGVELKAQPAPGEAALVLAADQNLGDAMRAGDRSAARKLLALQFTFVGENGAVHQRHQFLGELKNASYAAPTDAKAAVYGTVAIVTATRKAAPGGDVFMLHMWAKQKGAWRILTMQDVGIDPSPETANEPDVPGVNAASYECKNPCQTIPYRVRSPAEQEVINTFQTLSRAAADRDATEWGKHVADEFMHYRSDRAPISKSGRMAVIEEQKVHKIPAILSTIQTMRLWVFGDGAAMITTDGTGETSEPLLHTARIWVKRNGQWLMAISARTFIK
ncbi:MAG TPA: nuclear transport factor 2 family protein [Xanthobacteraceae bacterium]|jgi:hypothetical protein|nr:nuclear transport factor 2 family protein [Xanthobacteraceae bacterium]